jgi:hypothetical protein
MKKIQPQRYPAGKGRIFKRFAFQAVKDIPLISHSNWARDSFSKVFAI